MGLKADWRSGADAETQITSSRFGLLFTGR
jgi:hypothetical protein